MRTKITAAIFIAGAQMAAALSVLFLCFLAVNAGAAGFGAASLTNTQLRATPVPVSGPVTDAQIRATAVPVSGPVTDAQLRATPVPVSGTVTASGPVTDAQMRATAVPVTNQPQTTGGLSVYHRVATATTNAFTIKASPGQVYGVSIYNAATTASAVVFHDTAGTVTQGAGVFFKVVVPSGGSYAGSFSSGIAFSAGIGVSVVDIAGDFADTNVVDVAANEVVFEIFYK